jgi:hypothetical protein
MVFGDAASELMRILAADVTEGSPVTVVIERAARLVWLT